MRFRVKVREVSEKWATVDATNLENALHLVKVALFLEEEQLDDEADVAVDWDFPQQLDGVDCEILSIQEVTDDAGDR